MHLELRTILISNPKSLLAKFRLIPTSFFSGQTCVAAEQAPTSTSSVDDDGYALWRYLACLGHPKSRKIPTPLNATGTPQDGLTA